MNIRIERKIRRTSKRRSAKPAFNFRKAYRRLKQAPALSSATWYRKRGRELERVLNSLLREEHLDPRLSYRPAGEEIDGSFVSRDKVFLLEAKWHDTPVSASDLYAFKGKVDGKLVGTLGVFISISGYSVDAVDALTVGKDLNVVLFDEADVDACMDKNVGFKEVLSYKLRLAAEEALVYAPFKKLSVNAKGIEESPIASQRRKKNKG